MTDDTQKLRSALRDIAASSKVHATDWYGRNPMTDTLKPCPECHLLRDALHRITARAHVHPDDDLAELKRQMAHISHIAHRALTSAPRKSDPLPSKAQYEGAQDVGQEGAREKIESARTVVNGKVEYRWPLRIPDDASDDGG